MKGVVNGFKDSGKKFDIDCLQSNTCNQNDLNRLAGKEICSNLLFCVNLGLLVLSIDKAK